MTELKTFKESLKDEMKEQGITTEKLAELTGISPNHIRALLDSDIKNLPSAPYVRGYIQRLSEVLSIDGSALWKQYSQEEHIRRSGLHDTLPGNRFAIKEFNTKRIFIGIIAIAALIYIVPMIIDFLGKPSLEINTPGEDTKIVTEQSLTIKGKIKNTNDRVFINGTEIQIENDGSFEFTKQLDEGSNAFSIVAKRFLGREMSIERTVFYTPTTTEKLEKAKKTATSSEPSPSPSTSSASSTHPTTTKQR